MGAKCVGRGLYSFLRIHTFPRKVMAAQMGSLSVQSLSLSQGPEQVNPLSLSSMQRAVSQSFPFLHESTPFFPVPRVPIMQKQPFSSSHSQRSEAGQSALNVHVFLLLSVGVGSGSVVGSGRVWGSGGAVSGWLASVLDSGDELSG